MGLHRSGLLIVSLASCVASDAARFLQHLRINADFAAAEGLSSCCANASHAPLGYPLEGPNGTGMTAHWDTDPTGHAFEEARDETPDTTPALYAIAVVGALALDVPVATLAFLAITLACPLVTVLVMRGMHGRHDTSHQSRPHDDPQAGHDLPHRRI